MFINKEMKVCLKRWEPLKILLILFIASALMPDIISITGHSLKVMYWLFLILVIFVVSKKKIQMPPQVIIMFYMYITIISSVMIFSWGIDRLFINYCFGFCVIVLIMTLGTKYSEDEWLIMLQKVWILLVLGVCINNLQQFYRFVEYVKYKLDHPYINTIVTGGVNIEATWIAILVLAFFKQKKKWLPLIISVTFSLIYASRVGTIANIIIALAFVYGKHPHETKRKIANRRIICTVLGIIGIIIVVAKSTNSGIALSVLTRFKDIGHDPGSLGRFAMWIYVPAVVEKYPLGVGLGNVITALESVSPLKYAEDNIHNIFLQMFCEIGLLGGMAYIFIWVTFFLKEYRKLFDSPIPNMLAIYAFLCLFQFRGGETIFFCLVGIYLVLKKNNIIYQSEVKINLVGIEDKDG